MKVILTDPETATFHSLACGDVFKHGNRFFMKFPRDFSIVDNDDGDYEVNAVDLEASEMVYFHPGERVVPCSAQLILKPKPLDKIANL